MHATGSALKVLAQWRKEKKTGCTQEYILAVRRAITMFHYCWVFDEPTKSVVNINPCDHQDRNSAFNIDFNLDPKPNAETAMGIYTGELHPMTAVWERTRESPADRLHSFASDERVAAAIPLPTPTLPSGCTDKSVLCRFHLKDFPPYDRALTKIELQRILVLPTSEVPDAGIFSANGEYDRKKTLRTFQIWKRRDYTKPTHTKAKLTRFLRTRGKVVPASTSPQQVHDMCEQLLIDEANSDAPVRLFMTPYDDGLAEKRRRRELTEANILTSINAPSLVQVYSTHALTCCEHT